MASSTTTVRGVPPASLTMDMFSQAPGKTESSGDFSSLIEEHIASTLEYAKDDENESNSSQNFHSDEEDIFNLDMVTMDMDFEQAYSMYSQAQQKNALQEVEALRAAQQQLGMNPKSASREHKQPKSGPTQHTQRAKDATHDGFSGHESGSLQQLSQFSFSQRQLTPQSRPSMAPLSAEVQTYKGGEKTSVGDQFFSHTESDALEKFLDNLAYSSQVNPLELYSQEQPKFHRPFAMHTMPMAPSQPFASPCEFSESLKRDLTDAFKHPPSQSLKSFGPECGFQHQQLPTPPEKQDERKQSFSSMSPSSDDGGEKKRRRSVKPLLSSEQKRLNHSYSEQKRRMLCKEAYERCLLLVTNVDDYKNELASACPLAQSKKKSKRKQLTKDGLPNLSKHTALYMICNEILKIQSKNRELKELLSRA